MELESFILVPLEEIVQSKGTVEFSFGKVPAYIFADAIVWGVTCRIISKSFKPWKKLPISNYVLARNNLPILSSLEVLIANRDYEIVAFQLNL
jgi:hypothetical protein